jgi:hypothetical protein
MSPGSELLEAEAKNDLRVTLTEWKAGSDPGR